MRRSHVTLACLGVASACCISCVDTDALENKLTDLESKVEALEQEAVKINENAISAYKMINGGQLVMAVNAYENGTVYSLDLSDGSAINIYLSEEGEGITPIAGADADGNWVYSIDGGATFSQVEGGTAQTAPEFRVNSDYVWEMSTDGGESWKAVTDADGNKMIANTGGFSDSFFESVTYDEASKTLTLGLATGQEVKIPVQSLSMAVTGYTAGMTVDGSLTLDVTFTDDVAEAIVMRCPEGWRVQITEEGKFIVTAPADGAAGTYEVEIWLQSEASETSAPHINKFKFEFSLE